jgi:malate/lactate dehydrogenase
MRTSQGVDIKVLMETIQFSGDKVAKVKDREGSATLSMAYADAEFAARFSGL